MVWHTHEDNAQSRAAIAKLGATFEGLLRKHRRFGDGWRTTAQYAMTDDDWPAGTGATARPACRWPRLTIAPLQVSVVEVWGNGVATAGPGSSSPGLVIPVLPHDV